MLESTLTTRTVAWSIIFHARLSDGGEPELKKEALKYFLQDAEKWHVAFVREPVVEVQYDLAHDRASCAVMALVWVANPPVHMRWKQG